ncbi:hypothetical protein BDB00DRAFT_880662 [Zychaea mexicana]|uniref:uncharacterized protein n=1 Tax=Zychaea mexicana TaxID=64656 RepID=UPI0022FF3FAD|nr:uncharacterized protein BDB00DRAFT_880662 [Zychaea mexicana]KAI9466423.1 hypothetical protein BDB00DRAFT_880662 [Zychaea mexicana]
MVKLDDRQLRGVTRRSYLAIVPVQRDLATGKQIHLQEIIDQLEDIIMDTYSESKPQYQCDWTNNVLLCAKSLNITLVVLEKTQLENDTNTDKKKIENMLADWNEREYWVLEATKARAKETGEKPKSVEEKIHGFAVKCHFYHLYQSLIIDLADKHWGDVFSKEELDEMRSFGDPILPEIPQELAPKISEPRKMTSAVDAYNLARKLDYNIVTEPLLAWLALSVMDTAKYFIDSTSEPTSSLLKSDKLYYLWALSTRFSTALNEANAAARNTKRKLSAIEPIANKKMGSRTDTIYKISNIELGCLEIGGQVDETKDFKDSMIKMPSVLKT